MIGDPSEGRLVDVGDTRLWVLEMGEGHPLFLLHGGPGLDHTQYRPWMDPLAERFRLIYVDQRSQGRSDASDERTWSLQQMAADVTALGTALGLDRYAVLGQSFGSFVALQHAVTHRTASHYVLLGTVAGSRWLERIERNLAALEPPEVRDRITAAWDMETRVQTEDECRRLLLDQLPFHFADPDGPAYRQFAEVAATHMRFAPDVLRAFASNDYGAIEVEDRLAEIDVPVLVIASEFDRVTTPEAGWAIAEAVPHGECVLLKNAGHMMFVEQPDATRRAIIEFFDRFPP
ncbi:MAG TPA: alpha/beta hydrolase [Actinomycetota bacterium]|nr:alpha/beta hydrolase [Actinomycetota bacterium]